jgi:hypothetical protein
MFRASGVVPKGMNMMMPASRPMKLIARSEKPIMSEVVKEMK